MGAPGALGALGAPGCPGCAGLAEGVHRETHRIDRSQAGVGHQHDKVGGEGSAERGAVTIGCQR